MTSTSTKKTLKSESTEFAQHVVQHYGAHLRDLGLWKDSLTLQEVYGIGSAIKFSKVIERRGGWQDGQPIVLTPAEKEELIQEVQRACGRSLR